MKPWHQVIVPHKDIRDGRFDESVFAADLSDVLADRSAIEYKDPVTFFRKTYPTRGLEGLLSAMLLRLSGAGKGEPVIQIQTPFGGGKTHSLIALYHLFKHGGEVASCEAVAKVLEGVGLSCVPRTRVVAFVGTAADALLGKTPWGEIAAQLGRYAQVQEHDQKRRAPGKDRLHDLLADEPTLILMDEVAEYVVKAKDFQGQVMAFLQELTEVVKVLPQCALVVTLPSSAPYSEDGERALHQLQQVFGRVEAIKTPVEGEEIYEVIRRRLFEGAPSSQEVRRVAESYWQMYQELGDDVPRDVRDLAYRDRICRTYPFHPELLDVLLERWSTYSTFQRTRGVLRLLAQIVGSLYNERHADPLIQPCHLDLTNADVRGELLRHIGNEYEGVVASDISGKNAKSEKIDREMGSEYSRFSIASGLARAIFFGSFSGSEKRGVGIQRLRICVLREGLQPAIISDALRRMEEELWFLHVEGGLYSFSNQPNLNRVIIEKEEGVKQEHIAKEIRTFLEKMAGSEMTVILWPKESRAVPDNKSLKLAVLSPDYSRHGGATAQLVEDLLNNSGQTFRAYRNTLVLLVADANEYSSLREQVKRHIALNAIFEDEALMRQLPDNNKKSLESNRRDNKGVIEYKLMCCYRHLARAGGNGVQWLDLGLPTIGEKPNVAQRVKKFLQDQDLLLPKISPTRLLEKALSPDETEKPVEEVIESFFRYPNLPILDGEQVGREAIVQGVKSGVFGVRSGESLYFREPLPPSAIEHGAVVVRNPPAPAGEPAPQGQVEKTIVREGPSASLAPTPSPRAQTYTLRVKVSHDRFGDFTKGVVLPLLAESEQIEIEISILARSKPSGFGKVTLEQKVRETLRQIGAEILEERTQ